MSNLTVLNPVAKPAGYKFKLTDRLSDLKNITIGLVWNGKHGGNLAMQRVVKNIEKKLGYKLQTVEMKDDFFFCAVFYRKSFSHLSGCYRRHR